MTLIEGFGDEVLLIVGLFVIGLVLMLAWVSTYTRDIPLLRDVGVIFIELTQRRVRPDNEGQNVEVTNSVTPLAEERPSDSVDSLGADSTTVNCENVTAMSQESPGENENKETSGFAAAACLSSEPSNTNLLVHTAATMVHEPESKVTIDGDSNSDRETQSFIPKASVVVEETQGTLHSTCDDHPTDEEIRRRRVQYFNSAQFSSQSEGHMLKEGRSSRLESSDNKTCDSTPSTSTDLDCANDIMVADDQLPLTSQDTQPEGEITDNSRIRVKLKYMNETQRLVYANPCDTIGDFRRNNFQSELQEDKWVRFIYNGQDLRDDRRTLQACNISDNCTMHCLITSQTRTDPSSNASQDTEDDSFMGALMYPFFALVLLVVWYFRLTYRQYFSAMSTICLIGITFLVILSYISTSRLAEQRQQQHETPDSRDRPQQNHQHVD